MNSSYAVHFNVDCPVIIVRGITGKQRENDKLVYRVDCKGLKNEIVMDAQRHSNPSRNLFQSTPWMRIIVIGYMGH